MTERLLIYLVGFVSGVLICRGTTLIDGAKRLILALKRRGNNSAEK